jgi:hypothetical protein
MAPQWFNLPPRTRGGAGAMGAAADTEPLRVGGQIIVTPEA